LKNIKVKIFLRSRKAERQDLALNTIIV